MTTPAPDALTGWLDEASAALGLTGAVPQTLLLDLARDVAHGVARPGAPLTTFLVGLAAGRAGGTEADLAAAVATVQALLAERA